MILVVPTGFGNTTDPAAVDPPPPLLGAGAGAEDPAGATRIHRAAARSVQTSSDPAALVRPFPSGPGLWQRPLHCSPQ